MILMIIFIQEIARNIANIYYNYTARQKVGSCILFSLSFIALHSDNLLYNFELQGITNVCTSNSIF